MPECFKRKMVATLEHYLFVVVGITLQCVKHKKITMPECCFLGQGDQCFKCKQVTILECWLLRVVGPILQFLGQKGHHT